MLRWIKRDIYRDLLLYPRNLEQTTRMAIIGTVLQGRNVPFHCLLEWLKAQQRQHGFKLYRSRPPQSLDKA